MKTADTSQPTQVWILGETGGNPYLSLFAEGLRNNGLKVQLVQPQGLFQLFELLVRGDGWPDIIHLQWQQGFFLAQNKPWARIKGVLFFLQLSVLQKLGIRFAWTIHDIVNHERRQAGWELQCSRRLAHQCEDLFVLCSEAQERVERAYDLEPGATTVLPHGHYHDHLPTPPSREEARSILGVPENAFVVLGFGAMRPYKGFEVFVQAVAESTNPQIRLLLAGRDADAGYVEKLQDIVRQDERIQLEARWLSAERIATYLGAADVVALPYRDILFSGAAAHALSFARPLLMPRVGCGKDFPGEVGIFYEPGGQKELRKALERAQKEDLEQMGQRGQKWILGQTWNEIGRKVQQQYQANHE